MSYEQDRNNAIQYAIFKYQKTKDESKLVTDGAMVHIKHHLNKNGYNHAAKGAFIFEPVVSGAVHWLKSELQHAFKGDDFDCNKAIDELKKEISNSYRDEWLDPVLKVLEKAKSYI